jgi:hypothetical protein
LSVTAVAGVAAPPARHFVSAHKIGERALAVLVFLGGFVLFEPAPYELALVGLIVGWVIAGLKINRYILPLLILLMLYVIGGMISLALMDTQPNHGTPIVYIGTSALLAVSAVFFAAVIVVDPERRLQIIIRAYIAAAICAALIGIFGYFTGSELFTLYGRASGSFQDPNVLGPFLILPFSYLFYTILTQPLRRSFWPVVGALVMLVGIFLTFSRAAWGMGAFAILFTATMAFVNQRNGTARARLVLYLTIGAIVMVVAFAVLLSLPGTSSLFAERAQLVQNYDTGAFGRFERQLEGFQLMFDKPFGVGPFVFGTIFGEDEHNMWLKGFMVYGWLGGFAYIALAIWTMIISVPLMFKTRPWQPIIICAVGTFFGHLVIHNVIDNDHWRHLFLIYGIIWGAYAAERLMKHREARMRSSPLADVPVYRAAVARTPAS